MDHPLLQGPSGIIARCGYSLRPMSMSICICRAVRSLRFSDLGVGHADDAWNISARLVHPSSTSSDRLAIRSSTAEDMQRRALVFPIRAIPSGSRTSAGYKALAIRPQQNSRLATRRQQRIWQGLIEYGNWVMILTGAHFKPAFQ